MQKVIIDCDPGIDDTLALLYALASPELDVQAITVVCGNVPVEIGVENVFKCLEKVNRLDIPVYQGAASPLKRPFVSAQDTHGMDGLGETYFPRTSKIQAQALSAADYLAQTFQQATDCSIIALGPLTNIALGLKKNLFWGEIFNVLSQWVVPLKATAIALLLQNLIIGVILMQQLGF